MTNQREPPRFLADAMLERLARWMRALGYDVASAGAGSDEELVRRAAAEGRVLLTRDRRLPAPERAPGILLVGHGAPLEQLREVLAHFRLPVPSEPSELFTRCLVCNAALGNATLSATAEAQRRCPACERVYWEGSHTRRMRAALKKAFGESGE